jgi:hypothetical protein
VAAQPPDEGSHRRPRRELQGCYAAAIVFDPSSDPGFAEATFSRKGRRVRDNTATKPSQT